MTYQERKSILSILSTVLIFAAFCAYKYQQYPEEGLTQAETFHYWGTFVLSLTLGSIGAHIVISSFFRIYFQVSTGEKVPGFSDELDKLIDLKAFRNSFGVFILGFLLAMGSQAFDQPSQAMFIILIAAGFLSDVTGSITRLYHYRQGV
ncbi:hypothetical protein [Paenibacillus kobensis]|uniref:hypothetical protein n=1 Tax=Paenibacillus kobensis TaxID=59841 RepID=UPI000FD6FAA2|nr:hypothetical protein [Paenibacillus kobensis]